MTVAGHPFALCLTHDVDRVRKSYQTLYYAFRQRDPRHLRALLPGSEPYWQFEEIVALEAELGVRSAFYFLDEQSLFHDRPPREWLDPEAWKLYAARYNVDDPRIADVIRRLDRGGWEVGLHGSYESYRDRTLLDAEKRTVERVLGHPVCGGRQHYLNLDVPETWRHQRAVGLRYDASLGSSTEYGFAHGHDPIRPFDDAFVVFPLTLMEIALPDPGDRPAAARAVCDDLLAEAHEHGAVMTVLWHPRLFSEADYPGYRDCYRYLVERALELGAWVGPPGELYDQLDHPDRGRGAADEESPVPASDGGADTDDRVEAAGGSAPAGTSVDAGVDRGGADTPTGIGADAGCGSEATPGRDARSDGGQDTADGGTPAEE